jgi:hypothetical protein
VEEGPLGHEWDFLISNSDPSEDVTAENVKKKKE